MNQAPTVVVAMSGGVDSSVAAALLVERGYRVIGMMLRLWSEPGSQDDNRCCTPDSMDLARRVAAKLDIPFYAIDVQERFHEVVVRSFLEGYQQGVTPNPCILCNRQIRWGFLLERALAFGATYMATGHYARVETNETGQVRLLRGLDCQKDQSYVLSALDQAQLRRTMLPLGEYTKPQVRELARRFDLPVVAGKPDSQDLCFLGSGDYRRFLLRNAAEVGKPGLIIDLSGQALGTHQGLAFYTIGQRKGLGIAATEPLYVVEKHVPSNTLIVGPESALGRSELNAGEINWISGQAPAGSIRAQIRIRYKAVEVEAEVTPLEDHRAHIHFDRLLRDVTPGQRVVFYQGDECLGGGTIQS